MPNNIYHKRNTNSGVVPTAAQLTVGEIALNTADGKAYTRTTAGTVVELTEASVADGGEQFTPLNVPNLALWLDASDTSTLFQTEGSAADAVTSPTAISGCVGWWDATDASSYTAASGRVSEWRDKTTTGGVFSQATANNMPTLFTSSGNVQTTTRAAINGVQAFYFDGVNDFLTGNTVTQDLLRNLAGYTLVAVCRFDATSASVGPIWFGTPAGSDRFAPVFYGGTNMMSRSRRLDSDSASEAPTGSGATTSPCIMNFALNFANGRHIVRISGGEILNTSGNPALTTGLSSDTRSSSVSVGFRGGFNTYMTGAIGEIIIYNKSLTTAESVAIEKYLAAKWGLSNVHSVVTAAASPNDPVGAWRDKSGNGRHAMQNTASARPTISTALQNGRRTIRFTQSSLQWFSLGDLSAAFPSYGEVFVAYTPNGTDLAFNLYGTRYNVGYYQYVTDGFGYPATFMSTRLNNVQHFSAATGSHVISQRVQNNVYVHRKDGAQVYSQATSFDGGNAHHIGGWPGGDALVFLDGSIHEVIAYNSPITAEQRRAIEVYLANKWGTTTLAPQVINADAQGWINRVYANGGTVNLSTAAAVNTFCNAIDAAGIRDRFYRLNLFCGDNLAACLTPLYRGPSLSGTQFGNATDTNNNFTSSDYNERGANGGLKGNGSSKVLLTGLYRNSLPAGLHMGCFVRERNTANPAAFAFYISFDLEQSGYSRGGINNDSNFDSTRTVYFNNSASGVVASVPFELVSGDFVLGCTAGNGSNLARAFLNGAVVATQTGFDSSAAAARFTVFGRVIETTQTTQFPTNARIGGYTIGSNLTDTEAATYATIWDTFLRTLGRR